MTHALIIDDNKENIGVLAELLTLENVTHTRVQDPTKLPLILEELPQIDLIFLDLEMPEIDGYTILKSLQEESRFDDTPVIAYTVHVSHIHQARAHGFHSFLGKPLDADRFPQQLAQILSGKSVWTIA
ncbi:MAG: response regulator [Anaerolineae bacterium]|jgi:CheY-like chemotaxis protein|nr:response regulator [Anaerolineae bacterium]